MRCITAAAADAAKVLALMEALVACFEEYISERKTTYVDAFMGLHNFHKAILLDLLNREELPRADQRLYLRMARDTWAEAIEAEIRKRADA